MEASDEQLMLAYRDGDAGAFETLYSRHRAALFRFVMRSVRERARAEELYQEIWMRVIEARRGYQPKARFATWLYTIAHHRLVDHWRRHELRTVSLDEEADPGLEPAASSGSQPERLAESRQALERLASAIDALPLAQRTAFLLHEDGGLSVDEIAASTGAGEEATKSRLRYAYAKLRLALQDD